jgi:pimeloyl-ACP methyl ester carboxylesterase
MIHGFPGDSKSYADVFGDISETLIKSGLHTLRFDMRGCGQSDKGAKFFSIKSGAEDLSNVMRWAEKLGYKKLCLIAEGLGAAVTLPVLSDSAKAKIAGAVFLWPIFLPKNSWLANAVADHAEFGATLIKEIKEYDLGLLLPRITMPALVLCGSADTKAPPAQQADALKSVITTNNLEVIVIDGGDHGLKTAEDRRILLDQTRDFFRKIA